MDAAKLVRNAKAGSNKSHRALAKAAGIAASTITRIQSGRIEPTVAVLERILESCGHKLELHTVREGVPTRPRLADLVDAWSPGLNGAPQLDWTRWRVWLDGLAQNSTWIPEAIYASPPPSGNGVIDALIAAVGEKLADDSGLPRPSWTAAVPAFDPPFEPPARRRGRVAEQFEQRGLIIEVESLFRRESTVGA
jgi:transcriptional regulator with XRE-family HTH domain